MSRTLEAGQIDALAEALFTARQTREQIGLLSARHPRMTIADGYAIQRAWVTLERGQGHAVRGHKIGLTSRAMQLSANITEPDFAPLMSDMFFEQGSDVPARRFIVPKVEFELAFVLGSPLRGPGITIFDVLRSTEYVVPAIEIIDSRMVALDPTTRTARKVVDTIADFAANAGIVLGGRPVRPIDVDLRRIGVIAHKNAVVEETGLAAGVLNHPANGIAWLANRLAAFDEGLSAGEIVLGGSFTRPVPIEAGDSVFADYGELGSVSLRFA